MISGMPPNFTATMRMPRSRRRYLRSLNMLRACLFKGLRGRFPFSRGLRGRFPFSANQNFILSNASK